MFDDVRHERSLNLLLSLTFPDILNQGKITDHEIDILKKVSFRENGQTTNIKRASGYCFT